MALHPPQKDQDKLIFAPTGAGTSGAAEQFTKHELLGLRRADLDPSSPITQFHAWFSAAHAFNRGEDAAAAGGGPVLAKVAHPETCTLSTASLPSGRVSSRVVYLKELDPRGFVIYSNFGTSRKAADLATNRHAALTFWWEAQERQVRVEGTAERLTREESQRYFSTRVRGSRLGAWASRQSAVLEPAAAAVAAAEGGEEDDDGRAQLERWVREAEDKFDGVEDVPVPEFWGGLRVVPDRVEFWQGRQNRLHDRFVYEREGGQGEGEGREGEGAQIKEGQGLEGSKWTLNRLSP